MWIKEKHTSWHQKTISDDNSTRKMWSSLCKIHQSLIQSRHGGVSAVTHILLWQGLLTRIQLVSLHDYHHRSVLSGSVWFIMDFPAFAGDGSLSQVPEHKNGRNIFFSWVLTTMMLLVLRLVTHSQPQLKPLRSNCLQPEAASFTWRSFRSSFVSKYRTLLSSTRSMKSLSSSPPFAPPLRPMLMDKLLEFEFEADCPMTESALLSAVSSEFGERNAVLLLESNGPHLSSIRAIAGSPFRDPSQCVKQLSTEQSFGWFFCGHSSWSSFRVGNSAFRVWVETFDTSSESWTLAASRPAAEPKFCLSRVSWAFSRTACRYFPCASIRSCKCRCTCEKNPGTSLVIVHIRRLGS